MNVAMVNGHLVTLSVHYRLASQEQVINQPDSPVADSQPLTFER